MCGKTCVAGLFIIFAAHVDVVIMVNHVLAPIQYSSCVTLKSVIWRVPTPTSSR
jgi:hypothetical protein